MENVRPSDADLTAVRNLATLIVRAGIRPQSVAFGGDYRAVGGMAFLTQLARDLGERVADRIDAYLRYPRYGDFIEIQSRMKDELGLRIIHRYLSKRMPHRGLWGESAESLGKRFESALEREFPLPAVLLAPVEALVYWHYTKVGGVSQLDIPDDESAWLPQRGHVMAFSIDRTIVREFDEYLNCQTYPGRRGV